MDKTLKELGAIMKRAFNVITATAGVARGPTNFHHL
jgi:hypothetical protein